MAVISEDVWIINGWNSRIIFKYMNGNIFYSQRYELNWFPVSEFTKEELNATWEIYQKPKEESKGLWEMHNIEPANIIFRITAKGMHMPADEKNWANAFDTFIKLKGHRLAVKSEDNKIQYFILVSNNPDGHIVNLHVDDYYALECKLSEISPAFSCHEDAAKAIKDIGEDNLLHMFKIFQGLYQ